MLRAVAGRASLKPPTRRMGSRELCRKRPPLLAFSGPGRRSTEALTISAAFLVVAQSDQPSYDPPDLGAVGEAL